ncbi:hypothetical protein D3C72_1617620 [compost metagenome]
MLGRCIRSRSVKLSSGWRNARTRASTFRLSRESPPSSKKLSVWPTRSTPSTSCQMLASTRAGSVEGATKSRCMPACGAGKAARSSLPLIRRGNAVSTLNDAGTM